MPLNKLCVHLAEYLYCTIFFLHFFLVSNYEISEWQYHYLQIWSKSPEKPYITAKFLFSILDIEYRDIFKKYFLIYGIICLFNYNINR